MKRLELIQNVLAYHGGVIKREALEKLSDERLFAMMHPFDRVVDKEEDKEEDK